MAAAPGATSLDAGTGIPNMPRGDPTMTTATRARIRPVDWLLAPLRSLERSSGRRRRRLLLLYLALGAVAGFSVWWATSLSGLPDVGEPFDVAAFRAGAQLPESEDAFPIYKQAAGLYHDEAVARDWNALYPAMTGGWAKADPRVHTWIGANREALVLWREGTKRANCVAREDPADRLYPDSLLGRVILLTQAALIEGSRLEAEGDLAGALDWYLAVARACHHYAIKSRLEWRRWSDMMETIDRERMIAWASTPGIDVALIRRALAEAQALDERTPALSDNFKAEYIALDLALADLPALARADDRAGIAAYSYAEMGHWLRAYWFLKREPERGRRVLRLFFANWLAFCDLPANERPKVVPNAENYPIWGYYQADATAPPATRAVEPARAFAWLESTAMLWRRFPTYPYHMPDTEAIRRGHGVFLVQLAEKAYAIDHGEASPAVEALVPRYLKAVPPGYADPNQAQAKLAQ